MGTDTGEAHGLARGVVGSARTIAFGTSIVSPSASVATVLVLLVAYAGFASPLVVLITWAGSLCCALSIGQFAGRVPSAGWSYTYNSRGLGPTAGFLTGWMMIFAYVLFVPAGIGLTSAFGSEFRDEFRLGRHLVIPAAATMVFLFPLWGILFPGAYTLTNLLPFIAFGWLLIGAVIAGLLRARRPAVFQVLGRRAAPDEASRPQMS